MAKTLEAHDKIIREIFEGEYQFEIPDYQRPYAWTTEQTEELFDDLVSAVQEAKRSQSNSQYFLGSIVLIKNDHQPKSWVVDGQQRLSTITMLFAALRAAMPEAAGDITDFLYQQGKASLGDTNEYRLLAREEDAAFFRTFIQTPGGIERLIDSTERLDDSQLRYRENAILLVEKVRKLSPVERDELWKFLASECSLVVSSTPDLDAAYRIFSVLNNRGLDLAPIDILKASVLGSIRRIGGEQKGHAYAKKWSQIEAELGRDAFGELFGHIRTIYTKQKQRTTLMKEFQENVTEYTSPIELIEDVIEPYAEVWDLIRRAEYEATELADSINDYLSWLSRVDFKDLVPPALIYFKKFRGAPKYLEHFVRSLERLTYFLLVTRAGINERIATFAALTKEIEPAAFKGDVDALAALQLTREQQQEFVEALNGDIYRRLPKARMALVLRLEALVSDGSKKQTFKHLSLEHVLPQNPPEGSEWMTWFRGESDRDAWTHRPANLVPLHIRKNPAASNYDFETKKNVYFTGNAMASPFILTNEVRAQAKWTPEFLALRQIRLVNVLCKHWQLEASQTNKSAPLIQAAV